MISRKRPFGSKRAFSPVIAALILMLLAVAAGVVVYTYTMGWIGGATTTTGGTQGKLQIDSIYADTSASQIKIYVRNTGGKNLSLSKIYVDGVAYANTTTAIPEAGTVIVVQSTKYLLLSSVSMTTGYFYEVTVTCKDGTTITQSVEAD